MENTKEILLMHPFWEKVFHWCTPKKQYIGDWKTVPPQQQKEQQHFHLYDPPASPRIKKGGAYPDWAGYYSAPSLLLLFASNGRERDFCLNRRRRKKEEGKLDELSALLLLLLRYGKLEVVADWLYFT